jgi:hypothetical protein
MYDYSEGQAETVVLSPWDRQQDCERNSDFEVVVGLLNLVVGVAGHDIVVVPKFVDEPHSAPQEA